MKREHVILVFILVLAFLLRFYGVLVYGQFMPSFTNVSRGFHVRSFREATYGMAAWRIVEGDLPYRDFNHPQSPITPYLFALVFGLFGVGVIQARLFLVVFTTFTCFMIFLAGKMIDNKTGLLGSLIFAVSPISVQYGMLGLNDFIAMTFCIIGYYFLAQIIMNENKRVFSPERNNLILAGLFVSIGVMIRFNVVPLFLAFIVFLIIEERLKKVKITDQIKNVSFFILGFIFPLLIVFLAFYLTIGDAFLVQVLGQHFSKASVPLGERWRFLLNFLIRDNFFFFIFFSLSALLAARKPYGRGLIISVFLMVFLVFFLVPRQYYNYYEVNIPLMAMVSGFFPLADFKSLNFKLNVIYYQNVAKIALASCLIVLIATTNVSYPALSETEKKTIEWVKANTSNDEYILSDDLNINFRAKRRSPFAEISQDLTELGRLTGERYIEACYEFDVRVVVNTGRLFEKYETYKIFLVFLEANYVPIEEGYTIYVRTTPLQ